MKKFNEWNEVKKETDLSEKSPLFKEREIYNAKIGENIGFEQSGKGDEFVRPVLIVKRLTKEMFFGVPLSTTLREGSFFYGFEFIGRRPPDARLEIFSYFAILEKHSLSRRCEWPNRFGRSAQTRA